MKDEEIKQQLQKIERWYWSWVEDNSTEGKDTTYELLGESLKIIQHQAKELEQLKTGKTIGSLHNQIVNLEVKLMAQANEIERLSKPKRSRFDPGFGSEN